MSPLLYMRDVLHAISTTPTSRIGELTPLGWKRSAEARTRASDAKSAFDSVVRRLFANGA